MNKDFIANGVDLIWDGWFNSLKAVQQLQEDVEQKTLQAFSYQKEMLESSLSALNTIEEETKKSSKDWQEKLQTSFKDLGTSQIDQVSKWYENVQDITDKAQNLAWKPNNTVFDLLAKSQTQWETTVKNTLELQKQEREETFNKIEGIAEQLKESHKRFLAVK